MRLNFRAYRRWFLAAAVYNVVAGGLIALFPRQTLDVLGIDQPTVLALWQVVGMQILVFAPAYWWASREPWPHRHLILIGTAAKVLGLGGFLVAALLGQLPWSFGALVILNDVVWLPAFIAFVVTAARRFGWRSLIAPAETLTGCL